MKMRKIGFYFCIVIMINISYGFISKPFEFNSDKPYDTCHVINDLKCCINLDTIKKYVDLEITAGKDTLFLIDNFSIGSVKFLETNVEFIVISTICDVEFITPIKLSYILPGETKYYHINYFADGPDEDNFPNPLRVMHITGTLLQLRWIVDFSLLPFEKDLRDRIVWNYKYCNLNKLLDIEYTK